MVDIYFSKLLTKMVKGLKALHDAMIYHRDIKVF